MEGCCGRQWGVKVMDLGDEKRAWRCRQGIDNGFVVVVAFGSYLQQKEYPLVGSSSPPPE